ncbi:MAG: hypothetical protein DELT_02576 [Desulfovibrio sp.]
MEMQMKAGEMPRPMHTTGIIIPELVQQMSRHAQGVAYASWHRNQHHDLAPAAESYIQTYAVAEQEVRRYCCPRCQFVTCAITPRTVGNVETMALDFVCSGDERNRDFLGYVYIDKHSQPRTLEKSKMPEQCDILTAWEQEIKGIIKALGNLWPDVVKEMDKIYVGENAQYRIFGDRHDTADKFFVENFTSKRDPKGLFAWYEKFSAFRDSVLKNYGNGNVKKALETFHVSKKASDYVIYFVRREIVKLVLNTDEIALAYCRIYLKNRR